MIRRRPEAPTIELHHEPRIPHRRSRVKAILLGGDARQSRVGETRRDRDALQRTGARNSNPKRRAPQPSPRAPPVGAASLPLQRRSANECPCPHFLRAARAGSVRRSGERQPARLSLLRQGPHRRRATHGRPSALRRLLLAFVRLAGRRPVRRRDVPAALDARQRPDGPGQGQGQRRLRPVPHPRRAVLHLPRRRRGADRRDAARASEELRRRSSTCSRRRCRRPR